jgi:DHA2 family multidrug resistance protein
LNAIALCDLPRHILTQVTALRSLMRNLGGSIGMAILEALPAENTQVVHSRLVEHLRLDNPLAQAPCLGAPFSLTTSSGIAAPNAEMTRQAAMGAYKHDFALIKIVTIGSRLDSPPAAGTATPRAAGGAKAAAFGPRTARSSR